MSNNRLFLYHPSTGKRILIGKHCLSNWYIPFSDPAKFGKYIQKFYEEIWPDGDHEHFELRIEHNDDDERMKELEY